MAPLTDSERQQLRAQLRHEVQAEHERELELARQRKEVGQVSSTDLEREAELASLRQEVRAEYLLSIGYQYYTDSRGLSQLVSPEEFDRRQRRRRKKRKRNKYLEKIQTTSYLSVVVIILLSVALAWKIVN